MKIDQYKTKLEIIAEKLVTIFSHTHPEQKSDAMSDYVKALRELRKTDDWRVGSIRELIKKLYIYPNRQQHNEMLIEVHDLKEALHEERINKNLTKGLGEGPVIQKSWLPILVGALIILLIIK